MKLYSWNVNGIRAVLRKGDFARFLQTHDPDIVCLQETKATQDQIDTDFPQYEEYWFSADKKGYAGTAILTKYSPRAVYEGLPSDIVEQYRLTDQYGDTAREGRVLTLEFEPCYISTVYTPNAKDDLSRISMREQWDPAYKQYMQRLAEKKPVIMCGDFNVAHTELDLARPKENVGKKGFTMKERNGLTNLIHAGFLDTFREFHAEAGHYTWWSHFGQARARNVGWRIDYILASTTLLPLIQSARIHPDVLGSDHCPVSVELVMEL